MKNQGIVFLTVGQITRALKEQAKLKIFGEGDDRRAFFSAEIFGK